MNSTACVEAICNYARARLLSGTAPSGEAYPNAQEIIPQIEGITSIGFPPYHTAFTILQACLREDRLAATQGFATFDALRQTAKAAWVQLEKLYEQAHEQPFDPEAPGIAIAARRGGATA